MDQKLTERVHLLMAPSELKAIDDWGFAHRIRSRGEAIRRLIDLSLDSTSPEPAQPSDLVRPSAPRGPYPWENIAHNASTDLNVRVSERIKEQLAWIIRQENDAGRPVLLRQIVENALREYVSHELRARGIP
jgi:hypothetical protein